MKKEVVLVNEARGAVLDEEAVAEAVKEGKIAAFGCDVYSTEPFSPSHPYEKIKDMYFGIPFGVPNIEFAKYK